MCIGSVDWNHGVNIENPLVWLLTSWPHSVSTIYEGFSFKQIWWLPDIFFLWQQHPDWLPLNIVFFLSPCTEDDFFYFGFFSFLVLTSDWHVEWTRKKSNLQWHITLSSWTTFNNLIRETTKCKYFIYNWNVHYCLKENNRMFDSSFLFFGDNSLKKY